MAPITCSRVERRGAQPRLVLLLFFPDLQLEVEIDAHVDAPSIRALLEAASFFSEVVALKLTTVLDQVRGVTPRTAWPSTRRSVALCLYLCLCLSVCMPVSVSVCLSAPLSLSLSLFTRAFALALAEVTLVPIPRRPHLPRVAGHRQYRGA